MIVCDSELTGKIILAAIELIKAKHTWEQYAENVKKVYEELVGNV